MKRVNATKSDVRYIRIWVFEVIFTTMLIIIYNHCCSLGYPVRMTPRHRTTLFDTAFCLYIHMFYLLILVISFILLI